MSPVHYEPGELAKAKRRRVEIVSVKGWDASLQQNDRERSDRRFRALGRKGALSHRPSPQGFATDYILQGKRKSPGGVETGGDLRHVAIDDLRVAQGVRTRR